MRRFTLALSLAAMLGLPACISTETVIPNPQTTTISMTVLETVTQVPQTITKTVTVADGLTLSPDFYQSLSDVVSSSTWVTLYDFGRDQFKIDVTSGDPAFQTMLDYLKQATLEKTVKKQVISVIAGQTKTVEVTWLYGRGIMMDFKLSNGSRALWESSGSSVYYQTPGYIYQGSCDQGLWQLVSGIMKPGV